MVDITFLPGLHVGKEVMVSVVKVIEQLNKKHSLSLTHQVLDDAIATVKTSIHPGTKAVWTGPLLAEEINFLEKKEGRLTLSTAVSYPALLEKSPLKPENIEEGFNILFASLPPETLQSERVLSILPFGGKKVTVVRPRGESENVRVMTVQQIATQLLYHQNQFEVVLTGEKEGSILTTLAQEISGTPQLNAKAWICLEGGEWPSVYEATSQMQKIQAGKGTVNPISGFQALALLLRYSLGLGELADDIEGAIEAILTVGARTIDLAPQDPFVANKDEFTSMFLKSL